MNSPPAAAVFKDPVLLLAFGLGSGLSPRAPGTAGSLLAVMIYPFLALMALPVYGLFLAVFVGLGVWICARASARLGVHDHGGIVIDEFAGMWVAMMGMPATLPWMVAGFLVFRFFDIVKPWPIRMVDRQVHGGLGIMLDDLIAGVFTWVVLAAGHFLIGGGA